MIVGHANHYFSHYYHPASFLTNRKMHFEKTNW